MAAPPGPDHVVETVWGQGSLASVLQANNKDTSSIATHHAVQEKKSNVCTG